MNGNHIHFINAFAANDPHSTLMIWHMIEARLSSRQSCIFLNTRQDRRYRTKQLLDLCFQKIKPGILIIRGDNIDNLVPENMNPNIELNIYPLSSTPQDIIKSINNLNNYFVMGIGNMVGWGDSFVKELKLYE